MAAASGSLPGTTHRQARRYNRSVCEMIVHEPVLGNSKSQVPKFKQLQNPKGGNESVGGKLTKPQTPQLPKFRFLSSLGFWICL